MLDASHFADVLIEESELSFERYNQSRDVKGFDCGEEGLNNFLHDPSEVAYYQAEGYGTTTLVYYRGHLVGFFTLSSDRLDLCYVDRKKLKMQYHRRGKEVNHPIPAIKIGRFAVDKGCQGRGIGLYMMRHIVAFALSDTNAARRLLILEAYPESQGFYQKLGFHFTEEVHRERKRRNRTMYFDLNQVRDIA